MTKPTNTFDANRVADLFVGRCKKLAATGALDPKWLERELPPTDERQAFAFRWDERRQLFEFPLRDSARGTESGFIVVSTDPLLPPVFQYSLDGPPLSKTIADWFGDRRAAHDEPSEVDYWYFSSFELAIRLRHADRAGEIFLRFPHDEAIARQTRDPIVRTPPGRWQRHVQELWDKLGDERPRGVERGQRVLWHRKPIRYTQLTENGAIMGCTPVAWAMLASALKLTPVGGSDRIWQGSGCWNLDWSNASRCEDVRHVIWKFHDALGTDAGGGTTKDNIQRGEELFKGLWHCDWDWEDDGNDDWGDVVNIVNDDNPFIFSAQGQWREAIERAGGEAESLRRGKVGHSVLCYGYEDAGHQIFVSFGWGSGVGDSWIAFEQFGDNNVNYVDDF